MNGLFNPDMSDALTTTDARTKLNVALDRNDAAAMAQWARDYGIAALECCGSGDEDKIEDLEEEIKDLEHEVKELEEKVTGLEGDVSKLDKENDKLQEKINELEAVRA